MLLAFLLVGALVGTFAPLLLGAVSYYRTGTLAQNVTYDSNQRSDWWANAVANTSAGAISAKTWAYNVITSNYVYQDPYVGAA